MRYQMVISGLGGQGAVFLVKLLSHCAARIDVPFLGTENHGMSQRGGSVSCFIKLGSFRTPIIDENQADLLLAMDHNEGVRTLRYLKPDGCLLINSAQALPEIPQRKQPLDASSLIAQKTLPAQSLNVFLLGAACLIEGFPFPKTVIEETMQEVYPRFAAQNIAVLQRGYEAKL